MIQLEFLEVFLLLLPGTSLSTIGFQMSGFKQIISKLGACFVLKKAPKLYFWFYFTGPLRDQPRSSLRRF